MLFIVVILADSVAMLCLVCKHILVLNYKILRKILKFLIYLSIFINLKGVHFCKNYYGN